MRCIKCDGTIGSKPGREGFHCDACGSAFLDIGRIGGEGQTLDLAQHAYAKTAYRCPVDREDLRRYAIKGLEFEYCPSCRHIWLDRHEIEALVRKASTLRPAKDRPIDIPPDATEQQSREMSTETVVDAIGMLFDIIGAVGDW